MNEITPGSCAGAESRRPRSETQRTSTFKREQKERSQGRSVKRNVQRWRGNPRKSGVMRTREERERREWPPGQVSQSGVTGSAWWRWGDSGLQREKTVSLDNLPSGLGCELKGDRTAGEEATRSGRCGLQPGTVNSTRAWVDGRGLAAQLAPEGKEGSGGWGQMNVCAGLFFLIACIFSLKIFLVLVFQFYSDIIDL